MRYEMKSEEVSHESGYGFDEETR